MEFVDGDYPPAVVVGIIQELCRSEGVLAMSGGNFVFFVILKVQAGEHFITVESCMQLFISIYSLNHFFPHL